MEDKDLIHTFHIRGVDKEQREDYQEVINFKRDMGKSYRKTLKAKEKAEKRAMKEERKRSKSGARTVTTIVPPHPPAANSNSGGGEGDPLATNAGAGGGGVNNSNGSQPNTDSSFATGTVTLGDGTTAVGVLSLRQLRDPKILTQMSYNQVQSFVKDPVAKHTPTHLYSSTTAVKVLDADTGLKPDECPHMTAREYNRYKMRAEGKRPEPADDVRKYQPRGNASSAAHTPSDDASQKQQQQQQHQQVPSASLPSLKEKTLSRVSTDLIQAVSSQTLPPDAAPPPPPPITVTAPTGSLRIAVCPANASNTDATQNQPTTTVGSEITTTETVSSAAVATLPIATSAPPTIPMIANPSAAVADFIKPDGMLPRKNCRGLSLPKVDDDGCYHNIMPGFTKPNFACCFKYEVAMVDMDPPKQPSREEAAVLLPSTDRINLHAVYRYSPWGCPCEACLIKNKAGGLQMARNAKINLPIASPSNEELAATWCSHASYLVTVGGYTILSDPVWSDRCSPVQMMGPMRMVPVPIALHDMPFVDAVTISHNHYDHLCTTTIRHLCRHNHNIYNKKRRVGKPSADLMAKLEELRAKDPNFAACYNAETLDLARQERENKRRREEKLAKQHSKREKVKQLLAKSVRKVRRARHGPHHEDDEESEYNVMSGDDDDDDDSDVGRLSPCKSPLYRDEDTAFPTDGKKKEKDKDGGNGSRSNSPSSNSKQPSPTKHTRDPKYRAHTHPIFIVPMGMKKRYFVPLQSEVPELNLDLVVEVMWWDTADVSAAVFKHRRMMFERMTGADDNAIVIAGEGMDADFVPPIPPLLVTVVPAQHWSMRQGLWDRDRELWCSFVYRIGHTDHLVKRHEEAVREYNELLSQVSQVSSPAFTAQDTMVSENFFSPSPMSPATTFNSRLTAMNQNALNITSGQQQHQTTTHRDGSGNHLEVPLLQHNTNGHNNHHRSSITTSAPIGNSTAAAAGAPTSTTTPLTDSTTTAAAAAWQGIGGGGGAEMGSNTATDGTSASQVGALLSPTFVNVGDVVGGLEALLGGGAVVATRHTAGDANNNNNNNNVTSPTSLNAISNVTVVSSGTAHTTASTAANAGGEIDVEAVYQRASVMTLQSNEVVADFGGGGGGSDEGPSALAATPSPPTDSTSYPPHRTTDYGGVGGGGGSITSATRTVVYTSTSAPPPLNSIVVNPHNATSTTTTEINTNASGRGAAGDDRYTTTLNAPDAHEQQQDGGVVDDQMPIPQDPITAAAASFYSHGGMGGAEQVPMLPSAVMAASARRNNTSSSVLKRPMHYHAVPPSTSTATAAAVSASGTSATNPQQLPADCNGGACAPNSESNSAIAAHHHQRHVSYDFHNQHGSPSDGHLGVGGGLLHAANTHPFFNSRAGGGGLGMQSPGDCSGGSNQHGGVAGGGGGGVNNNNFDVNSDSSVVRLRDLKARQEHLRQRINAAILGVNSTFGTHKWTMFHSGDTGFYDSIYEEIYKAFGAFDFCMIAIGAYEPRKLLRQQHLDPIESVEIHDRLRSRRSAAMHWGTWILSDEPIDEPPKLLSLAMSEKYRPYAHRIGAPQNLLSGSLLGASMRPGQSVLLTGFEGLTQSVLVGSCLVGSPEHAPTTGGGVYPLLTQQQQNQLVMATANGGGGGASMSLVGGGGGMHFNEGNDAEDEEAHAARLRLYRAMDLAFLGAAGRPNKAMMTTTAKGKIRAIKRNAVPKTLTQDQLPNNARICEAKGIRVERHVKTVKPERRAEVEYGQWHPDVRALSQAHISQALAKDPNATPQPIITPIFHSKGHGNTSTSAVFHHAIREGMKHLGGRTYPYFDCENPFRVLMHGETWVIPPHSKQPLLEVTVPEPEKFAIGGISGLGPSGVHMPSPN